jgi:NADH:ubiquinone oxidoreductase subunit 2 (subunit N)
LNLGALLVVIVVAQATGSETIDAYKGLARRQPTTAVWWNPIVNWSQSSLTFLRG